jgi:hypothetical protein
VVDNHAMGAEGMSDMTTDEPPVPAAGDDATRDGLAAVAAVVLTAALIVFLVSRII